MKNPVNNNDISEIRPHLKRQAWLLSLINLTSTELFEETLRQEEALVKRVIAEGYTPDDLSKALKEKVMYMTHDRVMVEKEIKKMVGWVR